MSAQEAPAKPEPVITNDLDAFMAKVLARRDVNRQTLQQYILDDERDVRDPRSGPDAASPDASGSSRGTSATACTSAAPSGSTASRSARRTGASTRSDWIKRERERLERRGEARTPERRSPGNRDRHRRRAQSAATPVATSRASCPKPTSWTSSSKPATTTSPGREQLEGQEVLRIEYYPTQMFSDERPRRGRQRRAQDRTRSEDAKQKPRPSRATRQREREEQDIKRQDEQDGAGHALGRSGGIPDRQVHLRQRLARLPAGRRGSYASTTSARR